MKVTVENFCEPIITYIKKTVTLDVESVEKVIAQSEEVIFSKGEILLKEGAVSKYCYFIVSGLARSYYIGPDGRTTTWLFHFNEPFSNAKNLFINDYKSFLTGQACTLTIEALTEVRAIKWSITNFLTMCNDIPVFEKWMRRLNESFFIVMYDRISSLLTMSASDRYIKMLAEEPHLVQMFSNYYIASYLNITPPSLSRIRSRVSKTD